VLVAQGIPITVMAVPDAFIQQGSQAELLKQLELDATGVASRVRRVISEPEMVPEPATQPGG
jgi:deoxyxylulose-5-phosphate synthase